MQGFIGGAAGGQQRHDCVDDGLFTDHVADGRIVFAKMGQGADRSGRFPGQSLAQGGTGMNEGSAGKMQAQDFGDHLVGIGRAIKCADTVSVINPAFVVVQQGLFGDFPPRIALAGLCLFPVGYSRLHGAGRDHDKRQMTELQRTHHHAGQYLVAHPEQDTPFKQVVGQSNDRGHGNNVPTDET